MASTKQNVSEIISAASVDCAEVERKPTQGTNQNSLSIVSIQSNMIKVIALEYGVEIDVDTSNELLNELSAQMKDRQVHSSRQSMLGWLPGIENIARDSEVAAMTEALGWAANSHFEKMAAE